MIKKYIAGGILLAVAAGGMLTGNAQEQIVIEPLFEYPVAPDTISTLERRSEWVVTNFWKPMDFKATGTVDQNALNSAFAVYSVPMQWAAPEVTEKALNELIAASQRNPALALQMTKAAEECFYGPRAIYWSDKAYLMFIDALLKNKKIPSERKVRYERLAKILRNTQTGATPPRFNYVTPEGKQQTFRPNGIYTVIEFGDPGCDECRHARLKMETDVKFSQLVDRGAINVMFIIPDPEEGWEKELSGYSDKWHIGGSEEVSDLFDLRESPTVYIIDQNGKVAAKNIPVETAIEMTRAQFNQ